MNAAVYCYEITEPTVSMEEVEGTLHLAIIATEGICGTSDVRLDASYAIDPESRRIVIDATTDVGRCVCRIFTGFLANEYGEDAFHVRRADPPASVAEEDG